jgi:ABC-type multidrug transport system fused ATPase/permease subunit
MAYAWWSLVVLRGLMPAFFTLAMGNLVDAVQKGRSLGLPLALVGIVFITLNILGPLHSTLAGALGARASTWLLDTLVRACTTPAGLLHLERADLGAELSKARQFDAGTSGPSTEVAMPHISDGFAETLGGIAQAVILGFYRWWAPLLVAGAWASTHVLLRDSSVWRAWQDEQLVTEQRHVEYAYRLAVESPAAKEVRLFGLAEWIVDRYRTKRTRMMEAMFAARRLRLGPMRWGVLAVVASNALVFWALAHSATSGEIGLGALVIFAQAAIGVAAVGFADWDWWFRQTAQPIPMVLDLAEKMAVGDLAGGGAPAAGKPEREIRFDGVRFAYPTSTVPVFDGLDLTIPAGTSLAIVGKNGAGKTTLAKLLCRLYDPTAGAVRVDGADIREFDIAGWRSRLAVVFQDFIRYELSLRDNVAPAGAPDDAIVRALDDAGAGGLAELDTVLSRAYDGGTDFSGGQWQRIALARALCAVQLGAGVVLLDEPTAQLDVRGEAEIFDRILEATRGRTTILISHRFSTVRHADRICVLEQGRVLELGTHDELMALGGRYKTMFELQASRFTEGLPEDDEEGDDIVMEGLEAPIDAV